eukprot:TRINITY_DN768_c0_g1_i1.p1 TRINITY_DN768_c0_g1~~TRINITY_DN768_c0_g1_i1.p1  ORF type:complete len:133 (-),score=0.20 TRINITY_DN768_c0_g1_i1:202-600(-)
MYCDLYLVVVLECLIHNDQQWLVCTKSVHNRSHARMSNHKVRRPNKNTQIVHEIKTLKYNVTIRRVEYLSHGIHCFLVPMNQSQNETARVYIYTTQTGWGVSGVQIQRMYIIQGVIVYDKNSGVGTCFRIEE